MCKVKINKDKCKGCGLCVAFCPNCCLRMSHLMNAKGVHYAEVDESKKCTVCLICAKTCPDWCIEIGVEL